MNRPYPTRCWSRPAAGESCSFGTRLVVAAGCIVLVIGMGCSTAVRSARADVEAAGPATPGLSEAGAAMEMALQHYIDKIVAEQKDPSCCISIIDAGAETQSLVARFARRYRVAAIPQGVRSVPERDPVTGEWVTTWRLRFFPAGEVGVNAVVNVLCGRGGGVGFMADVWLVPAEGGWSIAEAEIVGYS